KQTGVVPADIRGFESIQPIYTKLKGWNTSTEGITDYDKLPKAAQEYLKFVERETGAKIGMISTGPERDQTMLLPESPKASPTTTSCPKPRRNTSNSSSARLARRSV